MASLEPKTPTEVRSYRFDWSQYLGNDAIASSIVTVDGATKDSSDHDATSVVVVISGGAEGTTAVVVNQITTTAGLIESESWTLKIETNAEPLTLEEVKDYLRNPPAAEDKRIAPMVPRARKWVEDHVGLALVQRQFTESYLPNRYGRMTLNYGPLVSVDGVTYSGGTYTPKVVLPSTMIYPSDSYYWPGLAVNDRFAVTYTAGYAPGEVDDRLLGAMLTLINDEYENNYAYSEEAIKAAERICAQVRRNPL